MFRIPRRKKEETRKEWITAWMGEKPQPFLDIADGFRFPRLGETTEVHISAIESAEVSFDQ